MGLTGTDNLAVESRSFSIDAFTFPAAGRRTLSCGIPLYLIKTGNEDVVRLDVVVKGGQGTDEHPMQALLTGRMLREGTHTYDGFRITRLLDKYGAWVQLSTSASHNYLTLYSLKKHFDKLLSLIASMLVEPSFKQKSFDTLLKKQKAQFLVDSRRVKVVAMREFNRQMFGDFHPKGHLPVLADFDDFNIELLREYFGRYYVAENVTLYLSGNVDEISATLLDSHFDKLAYGVPVPDKALQLRSLSVAEEKRVFVPVAGALQSAVYLGCPSVAPTHPDFVDLRFLIMLFGGYFGSRLMKNIREKNGYTYGIGADLIPYRGTSSFTITTQTATVNVEPLITEVYREMERLRNEPVPDDELERLRNYALGDLYRELESPFAITEAYLSISANGQQSDFFTQYERAIRTVDTERLMKLARAYFLPENMIEVVAGK